MPTPAALGFNVHTGWAAMVGIAGSPGKIRVLLRTRIELLPADNSVPRFVYHKAAELPPAEAVELVKRARQASRRIAAAALGSAIKQLQSLGYTVVAAGVPSKTRELAIELTSIPTTHSATHAAEGRLFRQALGDACQKHQIMAVGTPGREVWASTAEAWQTSEVKLRKQIEAARESVGPPWGADQKSATAMALLALWFRK